MEEKTVMSSNNSSTTTLELAIEGEKHLEETIQSAFQILSCIINELIPDSGGQFSSGDDSSSHHTRTSGGGAFGEARLRYKASIALLRDVVEAITNSNKAKEDEMPSAVSFVSSADEIETKKLEEQASILRKEIANKNTHLKVLINQLRDLVSDISTWQSFCPV